MSLVACWPTAKCGVSNTGPVSNSANDDGGGGGGGGDDEDENEDEDEDGDSGGDDAYYINEFENLFLQSHLIPRNHCCQNSQIHAHATGEVGCSPTCLYW